MAKKVASVGMRFDEKTRFGLEMLCRKRHRSAAGVVADLIGKAAREEISPPIDELWAADPPNRFLNLVEKAPHLLDHGEELVLATIKLNATFWQDGADADDDCGPRILHGRGWTAWVNVFALTLCWDLLQKVAEGEMTQAELLTHYGERLFKD